MQADTREQAPVVRITMVTPSGTQVVNYTLRETKMTTIGRAPDNAIVINNLHISKYHCTIELIDGEYFLHDHSLNGSWLNGVKRAAVELGHQVGVGGHERADDEREPTTSEQAAVQEAQALAVADPADALVHKPAIAWAARSTATPPPAPRRGEWRSLGQRVCVLARPQSDDSSELAILRPGHIYGGAPALEHVSRAGPGKGIPGRPGARALERR